MLKQYLAFYKLDDEAIHFLQTHYGTIEVVLPTIINEFYDHLLSQSETAAILKGRDISRLKKAQLDHWKFAITSGLNDEYMKRVDRIGRAHEKIGLTPVWYVGGYSFIIEKLASHLMNTRMWRMAQAYEFIRVFQRLILLDLALAVRVYEDACEAAKVEAMHQLLDTMENFTTEVGEQVKNTTDSAGQMNLAINDVAHQAQIASDGARATADQANTARADAEALHEVAQGITSVLEIITNVADQTNLLALNAAIESARAGEAGKGFAVVADEVRKLSGTTQESVDVISARIKDLQIKTKNVVSQFDAMVNSLDGIQQGSVSISAAVAQQSTAMQHITEGFGSLHQSVVNGQSEMKKLVHATATKK